MNLIECSLAESGGRPRIVLADKVLDVPGKRMEELKKLQSNSFVLGIRPEDIHLGPAESAQGLKAVITSVEPMGREILIHMRVNGQILRVISNARECEKGQQTAIALDLSKAHIFGTENRGS
jgi:ABC-type sugar transport system ATPase subunit